MDVIYPELPPYPLFETLSDYIKETSTFKAAPHQFHVPCVLFGGGPQNTGSSLVETNGAEHCSNFTSPHNGERSHWKFTKF